MAEETGRADLDAALERMAVKLGTGDERKHLAEHLTSDEEVKAVAAGHEYGEDPVIGVLVLTSRRVFTLIVEDDVPKIPDEVSLESATSVEVNEGWMFADVKVEGEGTLFIETVNKDEAKQFADAVRQEAGLG